MFLGVVEIVLFLRELESDTWVQLWAGVFGAVPAAVISAGVAAAVAVTVLNRSNEHQQALAANGIAEQKAIAAEQLAAQRDEAKRVREQAVMADLLGAANGFSTAVVKGVEAVEAQLQVFQGIAYRWEFEAADHGRPLELWKWSALLWKPAYSLAIRPGAPRAIRSEWEAFLREVTGSFTGIGITLAHPEEEGKSRSEFLVSVSEKREEFTARWDTELSDAPRSSEVSSPQ